MRAAMPVIYKGKGVTSRKEVTVAIEEAQAGEGISFFLREPASDKEVEVPARGSSVVNTFRNVVLGKGGARLCIVEHFLAAASLWGLDDLKVHVDGPEMPLGDGSANFWIELFQKAGLARKEHEATIAVTEPIVLNNKDRCLMALPDERFSMSYLMDWQHPKIGKRWQTWDTTKPVEDIAHARTFGWLKDHQLLGLQDDVVSLTEDGFTHPLRFEDEPVRHKLLDLLGDLALSGVNPTKFKARFVSIKGGHEIDVQMAKKLESLSK